ncbi:helix-turn-helix transcriptional regulator [Bacillus alkalicellulosilyticus]|uniref:helix-turn-helix transcriptional regulator n=1 Tax=Alkalihalobacterium alkalicellulosilyticum TaxID=1912214 RepID=UPI001FE6ABEB|nr:helix-turn-helix transcriptional regulator [Bacillus alkalicellulosilyticus]
MEKKLYNRVKELRARFNFTQSDLADKVGVTRQTIAAVEKCEYIPSAYLALLICREFNLPMENVFSLEEETL